MPADERSFSEPLPESLYLDTDIVIAYLVDTEPHHESCRRFIRRIAEGGRTTLISSSLTWLEYANVILKAGFRERLATDVLQHFRLNRWNERAVD